MECFDQIKFKTLPTHKKAVHCYFILRIHFLYLVYLTNPGIICLIAKVPVLNYFTHF
jgi:hypothetical protein